MTQQLEGRNSVLELLKVARAVEIVYILEGASGRVITEIRKLAQSRDVPIQTVSAEQLKKISAGRNHQGVVAVTEPYRYHSLESVLSDALLKSDTPVFVVLDGIQDPHNLGSIIRSAEVFGASAVIIPKNRAVGVTTAVLKTASGALEHVPVVQVTNISETIKMLKQEGFWIAGGDGEASATLWHQDLREKMALVVGSEGKGLSRLVKKQCDFLLRIPMAGNTGSLNASVAAAVLLYETFKQNKSSAKHTDRKESFR